VAEVLGAAAPPLSDLLVGAGEDDGGSAGAHTAPLSPVLTVAAGVCMGELWRKWGFEPSVAVGHSVGELAAAHAAGHLSVRGALKLARALGEVAARKARRGWNCVQGTLGGSAAARM
jgi:acyl transferase domain-containing protein